MRVRALTRRWTELDSNHRSRVRKSGRCQVPAIKPGSVERWLWEEVLGLLPWRAETSNSRSRRKTSVLRPMISARTARIEDNLGRGTDGSNPLPSSGESGKIHARACGVVPAGPMVRIRFPPMKRKVWATMTECFELIDRKLLKGPWVMGASIAAGGALCRHAAPRFADH